MTSISITVYVQNFGFVSKINKWDGAARGYISFVCFEIMHNMGFICITMFAVTTRNVVCFLIFPSKHAQLSTNNLRYSGNICICFEYTSYSLFRSLVQPVNDLQIGIKIDQRPCDSSILNGFHLN